MAWNLLKEMHLMKYLLMMKASMKVQILKLIQIKTELKWWAHSLQCKDRIKYIYNLVKKSNS